MRKLREPGGCAWDREQTHATMKRYIAEEAAEVVEAVDEGDLLHLCEELGDLLMIITFHARIAEEAGGFTMADVGRGIVEKLVSRHPHVFPPPNPNPVDQDPNLDAKGVVVRWQELKVEEKKLKQRITTRMDACSRFVSTMQASFQMQQEAASVGFDFPQPHAAIEKISEEAKELSEALQQYSSNEKKLRNSDKEIGKTVEKEKQKKPDKRKLENYDEENKKTSDDEKQRENIASEIGDLLFSVVNVARHLGVNPDEALKKTNKKFLGRFSSLEDSVEAEGGWQGKSIDQLDAIWNGIKKKEKASF
ncbi:MAG: MazG family protein [Candidatus Ozemobacteraceae bacterium]